VTSVSTVSASTTTGRRVGPLATLLVCVALLGFSLSVDFPRSAHGFKGDEATYYTLSYSLARDFDFAFTRADLVRVWDEFRSGPEGIFLKRGRHLALRRVSGFPWLRVGWTSDVDRLYFGKSFIYPLAAAPFVKLAGTNGFLVLHALLLTACFAAAVAWLQKHGSSPSAAVAYAAAFLGASIVPVYFVWLTPELFNFAIVLLAYFAWTYKEGPVSDDRPDGLARLVSGSGSDYLAAALLGLATFSKPVHIVLIGPLVLLALWRRQWGRAIVTLAVFVTVVAALFAVNYATTGNANYQGGDRKTFYGVTGFPFANPRETFVTTGQSRATDALPLEILVSKDTLPVFGHNLVYFTLGRYSGFVPYFFPGVVSLLMFFGAARRRALWQWLTAVTAIVAAAGLLLYMPYTYSGGGGPVGNRYYLSFYPLFLFATPALSGLVAPLIATGIGALFTAALVFNPFDMSFDPGAHAKSGPVRILPIELTQLNDLPVNAKPDRSRKAIAGDPPLMAYFPDDNAYDLEGDTFWVRGRSRADLILRAPAIDDALGTGRPLRLQQLTIEIANGPKPNHVTVRTDADRQLLTLAPGQVRTIQIRPGNGVPYRPMTFPTNYVYWVSIASENAFVPFLEQPGSSDSRLLGVQVRLVPTYQR
jgi:glycosyl transferase family 87